MSDILDSTTDGGSARRSRRRRTWVAAAALLGGSGLAAACIPPTPTVPASPINFTEHTVGSLPGAAFMISADVLGDSSPELVASGFANSTGGPGWIRIYESDNGPNPLDNWTATNVVTPADSIKFPNRPTVADLDGDGDRDVIVPGGFFTCEFSGTPCGSLQWFEQSGASWIRHNIVPTGSAQAYKGIELDDVDGDGILDMVGVGETSASAVTQWFKGTTGPDRFETTPRTIGNGGGSLPVVTDVDGDGDQDVISAEFFTNARSFVWFERTADPSPGTPNGTWVDHTINATVGGSFQILEVPNLIGNGQRGWVGSNHVNSVFNGGYPASEVFRLQPGTDLTQPWNLSSISTGIQARATGPGSLAPGSIGAGDIDGDGLADIAVSGDGDERLFWLQQQPDHSFTTYQLDVTMGQAGGALVVDLDGNGTNEVVFTSYEQSKIVIYQRP